MAREDRTVTGQRSLRPNPWRRARIWAGRRPITAPALVLFALGAFTVRNEARARRDGLRVPLPRADLPLRRLGPSGRLADAAVPREPGITRPRLPEPQPVGRLAALGEGDRRLRTELARQWPSARSTARGGVWATRSHRWCPRTRPRSAAPPTGRTSSPSWWGSCSAMGSATTSGDSSLWSDSAIQPIHHKLYVSFHPSERYRPA